MEQRGCVDLERATDMLASAMKKAVAEHGRPNSFSCKELAQTYGGPSPLMAGKIGRHYKTALWRSLGGVEPRETWGSRPEYKDGRFYV